MMKPAPRGSLGIDAGSDPGAYIRALVKDIPRLRATIQQGREREAELLESIRSRITLRTGIGLLHQLALAEIARATRMSMEPSPNELCGHARFLRGLIVAGPLDREGRADTGPGMEEVWDRTMTEVAELWTVHFFIERLSAELAKHERALDERQADDGSLAATLGRTEVDIGYVEAIEERCREVFGPLDSEFVQPAVGLGVVQLLAVFPSLVGRMNERINLAWRSLRTPPSVWSAAPQTRGMADLAERLSPALVVTATDLPLGWTDTQRATFLSAFSMWGGEENTQFRHPRQDNATLRKPLLRLEGGRFLIMDPLFCRYAPYRMLVHLVESSPFRERFLRERDRALEVRTHRVLAPAIKPAVHHSGYFLPVGANGDLAEHDHLYLADRRLFFVECKARRLRSPAGHGGDPQKIESDLRKSVQVGFEQGDRARRYMLEHGGIVPILDEHGNVTAHVDVSSVRQAHVIVVTWDNYAPLTIDLQPWVKVPDGVEYPWVVCIDDLQTALTRLNPASRIGAFIRWRSPLNGRLWAGDELDVVGCFLAGHTDFAAGYDVHISGDYADVFDDDYFARHGISRTASKPDPRPALIRLGHEEGRLTGRLKGERLFKPPLPVGPPPEPTKATQKPMRRFKKRRTR